LTDGDHKLATAAAAATAASTTTTGGGGPGACKRSLLVHNYQRQSPMLMFQQLSKADVSE